MAITHPDPRVLVCDHDLAIKLGMKPVPFRDGEPIALEPTRPTILTVGVFPNPEDGPRPKPRWLYWDIGSKLLAEITNG